MPRGAKGSEEGMPRVAKGSEEGMARGQGLSSESIPGSAACLRYVEAAAPPSGFAPAAPISRMSFGADDGMMRTVSDAPLPTPSSRNVRTCAREGRAPR